MQPYVPAVFVPGQQDQKEQQRSPAPASADPPPFGQALDNPPPSFEAAQSTTTARPIPNNTAGSNNTSLSAPTANSAGGGSTTSSTSDTATDASYRKEFKTLDTDGNGFVTKQEIQKKLGKMVPAKLITMAISMVDTNKDGKVSFEEYKKIRTQIATAIPGLSGKKK
jgi:hypothetical protein